MNVTFYTGEAILNTLKHKPDHVGQVGLILFLIN